MRVGHYAVAAALVALTALTYLSNLARLATLGDRVRVALFLLACVALGFHFLLLDTIRRFRVKAFTWNWRTGLGGEVVRPESYAREALGVLHWVRWWRAAALLLLAAYIVLEFSALVFRILP